MSRKEICKIVIIGLVIISATGGYKSMHTAAFVDSASNIVVPLIWFALLSAIIAIAGILMRKKTDHAVIATASMLPSVFFALEITHVVMLVVSTMIIYTAVRRIKADADERKKVRVSRNINAGIVRISMAVALVISSQYFIYLQEKTINDIVPQITDIPEAERIIDVITTTMSPNMQNGGETTIDSLTTQQQGQASQEFFSGNNQINGGEELKKNLFQQAGEEISGDETVTDVIAKIANQRIKKLLGAETQTDQKITKTTALVISLVVFITVLSIYSFVRPFIAGTGSMIFTVLKWTKVIAIEKKQQEVEVIV
ncbi:MAG: hypothetical protein KC736_01170 [Candidatus Moranbacteria bacterium]|nr:hypothetical protein [Candidatus Moranbacteria bacterium]